MGVSVWVWVCRCVGSCWYMLVMRCGCEAVGVCRYMLVTFPLTPPLTSSPSPPHSLPPSLPLLFSLSPSSLPPPLLSPSVPPSLLSLLPSLSPLSPSLPQSVENKVTAILPMFRVSAHARPTLGSHTAVQDGIYEIIWDNTYSR